jgi:enoyl-CoA hydratase
VSRVVEGHDFYEGVRAAVIDKDGAPNWRPPRLADVREADVRRHFDALGSRELEIV